MILQEYRSVPEWYQVEKMVLKDEWGEALPLHKTSE